ncbi:MAG: serine/threonine protein kinase [Deltaproteobacteria bacterium]|nr:serine/threonine protein kinase [Deltaproteobacteria bacterium]
MSHASISAETDLFLALSPDAVLSAVEAGGLACRPVCFPLNSFENRVYMMEAENGKRIISKFYRPLRWSRAQILEEHQFLADLAEKEVPVCPVLPFPDGETVKRVNGIYYCLFESRGGRAPEELRDEDVERMGMLVARMHNVGAEREAAHRLRIDAQTYVHDNLDWLEQHQTVPPQFWPRYRQAAEAIAAIADDYMSGVECHRIHGDFHLGNVLLRDGVFNVLDFDDMVVGPAVQDLWLALPGRDAYTLRQREVFLEGYQRFREFDRRTLRLIEPLRGLRVIHYATWLAKRWHDAIFPRTWPHFGTEDYWLDETRELEDLLVFIRDEGGLAPAEPEQAELSNKDYFFDWED